MENVVIKVGGMSCQGCVKNLTGALSGLAGVEVSLEAGEARVGYDPAKVSTNALRTVIEDCGFDAA